jgi:peptidoglycan/xylan/chitin deacetylase (PgdA/CDA1 family)
MSFSKNIARNLVFPIAMGLKADKLLSLGGPKCCIINFHGVTSVVGKRFNNRHIDVREFEKTIRYLKNNFDIVSLREIFKIHQSKVQPKRKTIAITFDDGYENNFTQALPVLKKYNVPATFYLIAKGLVDENYFVWPDMIDLVQQSAKEDIKVNGNTFKHPGFYCEELKMSLVDFLKQSGKKRDNYVDELVSKYPLYKVVLKSEPQLINLIRKETLKPYVKEDLIEYGSHTYAHYNLEYLTKEECETELKESKRIIEEQTGREVISIAFPDGSYKEETVELVEKCGYKNMTAVDYKLNENNKKENILSRFTISNSTTFESNALRLAIQFKKYGF